MKVIRFMLSAVVLMALSSAVVISLSRAASANSQGAQSDPQKSAAQKSFEQLKGLEGAWEGHVTTTPPMADTDGGLLHVTLRVTSRGNALMHEMRGGSPDDPITMLYLDGDRLMLTHYCDAGNRPRMTGRASADGKSVEFEFLDVAGNAQYGHMHHAVFTTIDANHHSEDWTFMVGDKPIQAHMDLQRTK